MQKLAKDQNAFDALLLVVVYAVVSIVKLWWVSGAIAPFIFGDEYFYKVAAQSLYRGQGYFVDGHLLTGFPPLYSLLLLPAFLSASSNYEWILRINVIISTLAIIPVWLFARNFLSRQLSWLCVVLVVLDPMQWVFPRNVVSENLYIPLLLTAIYLLITDSRKSLWLSLAIGTVLGLCFLTRFITLTILPLVVVMWWLQPWLIGLEGWREQIRRERLRYPGILMAGFVLTLLPWVLYVVSNGQPINVALGIRLWSNQAPLSAVDQPTATLVVWTLYNAAGLVTVVAPCLLAIIAAFLVAQQSKSAYAYAVWLILTGMLLFFLAGTTYSAPKSSLAESVIYERYYVYLTPLLPIIGLAGMHQIKGFEKQQRIRFSIIGSIVTMSAVFIAARLVTESPRYYFLIHEATYSFALVQLYPLPTFRFINFIFILSGVCIVQAVAVIRWPSWTARMTAAGILILYAGMTAYTCQFLPLVDKGGQQGREIATWLPKAGESFEPVIVYIDEEITMGNINYLKHSIQFWDVSADSYSIQIGPPSQSGYSSGLWVTKMHKSNQPLAEYQIGSDIYYIYRLPFTQPLN